jgi:hypothetical protein
MNSNFFSSITEQEMDETFESILSSNLMDYITREFSDLSLNSSSFGFSNSLYEPFVSHTPESVEDVETTNENRTPQNDSQQEENQPTSTTTSTPANNEETKDDDDLPDLIPIESEPESPPPLRENNNNSTDVNRIWRNMINDYQENIRIYQRNMRSILDITNTLFSSSRDSPNTNTTRTRTRNTPPRNNTQTTPSLFSVASSSLFPELESTTTTTTRPNTNSTINARRNLLRSVFNRSTGGFHIRENGDVVATGNRDRTRNANPNYTFEIEGITIQPLLLSDIGTSSIPTPEQIAAATEHFTYSATETPLTTNTCPITLEEFQEGDNLCRIKHCGHIFKNTSLQRWFRRNCRCPSCRHDIRIL